MDTNEKQASYYVWNNKLFMHQDFDTQEVSMNKSKSFQVIKVFWYLIYSFAIPAVNSKAGATP